MKEKLDTIKNEADSQLAAAVSESALEELRIKYLGKKGELTSVLRGMGELAAEVRPVIGQLANEIREYLENKIAEKSESIKASVLNIRLASEKIDVTRPGRVKTLGKRHPLAQIETELCEIFRGMGFDIITGPEVEYDYYNFGALNMPENHPARNCGPFLTTPMTTAGFNSVISPSSPMLSGNPGQ